MLKKVRNVVYTIGDETGELAKRLGCGTAGVARRFGSGTADIAKRVGPKRGLLGLAIAAAAIGGTIMLVRYLRARSAEELEVEAEGAEQREMHGRKRDKVPRTASHVPMPH